LASRLSFPKSEATMLLKRKLGRHLGLSFNAVRLQGERT
jgi:hypothetical protein